MKTTKEQLKCPDWWAENQSNNHYYLQDNNGYYYFADHYLYTEHSTIIAVRPVKQLECNDPVNSPDHYNGHPSGIECIEVTKHYSFCIGNAIKYIWRHKDKGKRVEDLKKAVWYLEQQIKIYDSE
jgi:hypothetical protein